VLHRRRVEAHSCERNLIAAGGVHLDDPEKFLPEVDPVAIEVLEALEKVAESPAGDHRQRILAADAVGILGSEEQWGQLGSVVRVQMAVKQVRELTNR
jgi:hypothetical protein